MQTTENNVDVGTAMERDRDNERPGEENSASLSAPPLPTEAHGRIGRHLRKVYGELLAEPMPDKFGKLLDQLSKSEGQK